MAACAALYLILLIPTWGMPRSRSRSPLYSPTSDLRLSPLGGHDSSHSDTPHRRTRQAGQVSDSGLYHVSSGSPSIFMQTSTVMPEPDETTTCQQLTSCLTGPYQPTHAEFIDSLAEHVLQYRIGPPLQRSLLMIFIQDHRERLRQQSSSGSGLVRVVMPSLHKGSGVAGAACCDNEDNRLRIKRRRTNRWKGTLARRGRLRARKRRRCSEMPSSKVFANMRVPTACYGNAGPRLLIELCTAGRVALQVLSSIDFGGPWLQVMVSSVHDLHDIARWCLGLRLALLSLLNKRTPEARTLCSISCLLHCTFALEGVHGCRWMCLWHSPGWRLVIYCLGQSIVDCTCWMNAIASALLLRSIRLILFLLWPVNIFQLSWQL